MEIDRTWVLLLLPVALAVVFFARERSYFVFPSLDPVPRALGSRFLFLAADSSRVVLLLMLFLLSAGVRFSGGGGVRYGYGADIVFLLDESRSMIDPFNTGGGPEGSGDESKFTAAKAAIARFMETRKSVQDRYGLTAFGQTAVTVLPLSMDHDLFLGCLRAQEAVLSSTFLYYPVASGLDELMRSRARSRVLILVSDGGGPLDDEKYGFSRIVRKHGIRFYWVSLGTEWLNELPQFLEKIGPLGRRMDVSNGPELEKGFEEIHRLERSLIRYSSSSRQLSPKPFIFTALLLMAMTWISHSLFVYRRDG
jgi:hypothetical protein